MEGTRLDPLFHEIGLRRWSESPTEEGAYSFPGLPSAREFLHRNAPSPETKLALREFLSESNVPCEINIWTEDEVIERVAQGLVGGEFRVLPRGESVASTMPNTLEEEPTSSSAPVESARAEQTGPPPREEEPSSGETEKEKEEEKKIEYGCVWSQFITRSGFPIAKIPCKLIGAGKEWPEQETSLEGEIFWEELPLEEYRVEFRLEGRVLPVTTPWLREKTARNCQRIVDSETVIGPLESPFGIQARLLGLGYDCGPLDGIIGPLTKAAVKEFQEDQDILVDGIPGPITQGFLSIIYDEGEEE